MVQEVQHHPIDAVITWVDGLDPAHLRKRKSMMGSARDLFHENAINPHRWACNGELYFCLASLEHNAPWLRKIWIVVDAQSPNLSRLSATLRAKIRLVDHTEIFANHGAILPTFNSLAIETFLWNIPGLSDQFIYFNDDVFLTSPCQPSDFFTMNGPILRGTWGDFSYLQDDPVQMADPVKFNHYMQINAAALCGVPSQRLFRTAHVAHPCLRPTMAQLHSRFDAAFRDNAGYRMRDINQFSPQSLHNHACILN
ncbi:Stealth CR1 domain-containing protein, partial [Planktomarina sp.]|nr:Stealth CR1 domain-containing protein [Planktomarina sp.]